MSNDPFEAFEASLGDSANTTGETVIKPAPAAAAASLLDDPAADFLAREQVELAKIENGTSNGFDDFGDFGTPNGQPTSAAATGAIIDTNDFETADPFHTNGVASNANDDAYAAISRADMFSQEPEKLKVWREEQKTRLLTKDADEEVKKREWRESAKKELDDWYKNRQDQLAKINGNNRAAEAELLSDTSKSGGQEWDRLAKLCDFNPKSNKNNKDVGRMRSVLLQLKQQPLIR